MTADGSAAELSPIDAMAQLTFVVQRMLEERAADQGITIVALRMLGILRDRTPTMADLATRLELDKSSITGLVDRAERRGLVARVPSTADKRSVLVELTPDGRRIVAGGEQKFEADVAALLGLLPASDRAALVTLVTRLLALHDGTSHATRSTFAG
ncbi:MarR family winged helix-turn-helix transcriptional regulator [Microbacterium rhizomatis]|uniref:MarR family transcriptional regulator n=1 Tax=Microbacterium rhizomatis TaxID=1631477 RepID=A0A5J5J348_9MICO|nr:MarR family transcriptional regulator [Microbacterium rhizomatis]KAA9107999.1 MarR family transcriptional regulator [Microbacterium rhizomatis]